MRILIVDDSDMVREALCAMLTIRGYDVVTAASGPEALERIPAGVDLLVADLWMPGMDGVELIARARRLTPDLPAVVVTGSGVDAARRALRAAGQPVDVIEKSTSCAEQIEAFARAIGNRDVPRARLRNSVSPARAAGGRR